MSRINAWPMSHKNNVEDFFFGHPTILQDYAIEILFIFDYMYAPLLFRLKY